MENLFNTEIIADFLNGRKTIENLPELEIQLFLNEQNNPDIAGKNNFDQTHCDGLRLVCKPRDDVDREIKDILEEESGNFPFEFYTVSFTTFADQPYTGYRKFLKHLLIDSSQISNEYATREYIKSVYKTAVGSKENHQLQNQYRMYRTRFRDHSLKEVNNRLDNYQFSLKKDTKSGLENDLTIIEDSIPIENRGKGRQCFIKTEFALNRKNAEQDLDVLLLEEPENHLSHTNMHKLVQRISESNSKQVFIATHSNMIASRLNLKKAIMLNNALDKAILLKELTEDTASFFMKAPDNNILEFALSKKVILVEGDAEFILLEAFFENIVGTKPEFSDIHIISVGGTSFKRYLELAKLLGIKTAVIRDNDGNAEAHCKQNYEEFVSENAKVFFDTNDKNKTFEVCVYACNQAICDELFLPGRRTLSVLDYMLGNKAEAAFELLNKKDSQLVPPAYIKEAISWIRK